MDGYDVQCADKKEEQAPQDVGGPHGGVLHRGEHGPDQFHVIAAKPMEHEQGQEKHQEVHADGEQLIGQRDASRRVADEQKVLELHGVLLHQKVDAEHENEEGKHRNEQSHPHDDTADHLQKIGGLACLQLVLVNVVAVLADIAGNGIVRRIVDLHDEPRGRSIALGGKLMVAPANEVLGDEDGVQAVGEAHYPALHTLCPPRAKTRPTLRPIKPARLRKSAPRCSAFLRRSFLA